MLYLFMCHDKHCICTLLACLVVALCHTPKFFSKRSLPNFWSCGIVHQLFIAWYSLPSHGVYHGICVVFRVVRKWYRCVLHEVAGCEHSTEGCFPLMVRTFIACLVAMRWVACKGKGRIVVGGSVGFCCVLNKRLQLGGAVIIVGGLSGMSPSGIGWTLLIKGMPPCVLLRVDCQWTCGVIFKTLFAVGSHACIIGGASVILGTVRIGVSSITLCSSSLTLCSLCVASAIVGGCRISSTFDWRSLMSLLPLLLHLPLLSIWPTCLWVCKSVCAGSCLAFGSVVGKVLWNPRFDMPESWEYSTGHVVVHWWAQVPSINTLRCPRSSGIAIFVHNCFASQRGKGILVPTIRSVECFVRWDSWVDLWSSHQIKCVLDLGHDFVPQLQ